VSGNNINVAVQPIIAVTVVVTRFNLTNDDNVTMETTVTREATEVLSMLYTVISPLPDVSANPALLR